MSDTPEKVETVEEATTATPTTEAKPTKKAVAVDVNELANKSKEGAQKAMGFVSSMFSEDPEKGMNYAMMMPLVFAVLSLFTGNVLLIILNLLVAAAGFLGIKALKEKLFPKAE